MTGTKIIRTEKEYNAALSRIEKLMDAAAGSIEGDELELLVLLVEKYENEHFPIEPPDPVEAILFRMEQEGLTASDMVPYLGTQSRVSEVFNRKRPLSLRMIRNLHQGLKIPLESLIQDTAGRTSRKTRPNVDDFTYYYNCLSRIEGADEVRLRQWYEKVLRIAFKQTLPPFEREKSGKTLVEELFSLCAYSTGPKMAHEILNNKGIHLIIQKKPGDIELDGACFMSPGTNPVIGLTMQKKELDQFWYILLHLVAHIILQQEDEPVAIFDSIECSVKQTAPRVEIQANEYLKSILNTASSLKSTRQSYQKAITLSKQVNNIQAIDISPEMFSCWYRIDNQGRNVAAGQGTSKKVSEKLEVYIA